MSVAEGNGVEHWALGMRRVSGMYGDGGRASMSRWEKTTNWYKIIKKARECATA